MGKATGIEWTDSTVNFWIGCTKVGPGCDNCYAEAWDAKFTSSIPHWGAGVPRRRVIERTRNEPLKWERDAGEFLRANGHRRRVFCSSLADIFDNEVPRQWREEAFVTMEVTPNLDWQLCTKRVSNIEKMVPETWKEGGWPKNVGVLITVVTVTEVERDVRRLIDLKRRYRIPWIGLSLEPLVEDVADALRNVIGIWDVDWFIVGGESGPNSRPYHLSWAAKIIELGVMAGIAIFHKQVGENVTDDLGLGEHTFTGKGKAMEQWPEALRVREFPTSLA